MLSMGGAIHHPSTGIAKRVTLQFNKVARQGSQNDLMFAAVFRNILRTDPDLLS
jgi:hypothetical protein